MKQPQAQPQFVDGPAIVSQLHTQDRSFVTEIPDGRQTKRVVSQAKGWRKLTPIQAAYLRGQLKGGNPKYDEHARKQAADDYATLFLTAESGGKDSTQGMNISRSTGSGSEFEAKSDASRKLACLHSHMGERDRRIVMLVCGEGYSPAAAIRHTCGSDYQFTVCARLRESLDALLDGLDIARRHGWNKVSMEIRA